jgi:hypothetical protein
MALAKSVFVVRRAQARADVRVLFESHPRILSSTDFPAAASQVKRGAWREAALFHFLKASALFSVAPRFLNLVFARSDSRFQPKITPFRRQQPFKRIRRKSTFPGPAIQPRAATKFIGAK